MSRRQTRIDPTNDLKRRARRAFERRFGGSLATLKATHYRDPITGTNSVKIHDPASGAWAMWTTNGPRLKLIGSGDPDK